MQNRPRFAKLLCPNFVFDLGGRRFKLICKTGPRFAKLFGLNFVFDLGSLGSKLICKTGPGLQNCFVQISFLILGVVGLS